LTTLFIADLHLSGERPEITDEFLRFLREDAATAEALYILGDLFEFWIGDDFRDPALEPVLLGLKQLSEQSIPVYLQHGNRDFFIREAFLTETGCQLLKDPVVVDLYGVPTLLTHGDALCTDDIAYQAFRRQVRNPEWQTDFLSKPLEQRLALVKQARTTSQEHTQLQDEYITDVNQQAVEDLMSAHKVQQMIHGHTHRPHIHQLHVNGHAASRIVLGDWYEQTSILACDTAGCKLHDRRA
jgi:UDP-2,3-diacylglucosamine hydrolase